MSLKDLKEEILQGIEPIINFDLSLLYSDLPNIQAWHNEYDQNDLKDFLNDVISTLQKLKNQPNLLDTLAVNSILDLRNRIKNLNTQLDNIKNLTPKEITNHHHNPLNHIQSIDNTLRSSGIYNQLNLVPDFDTFKKNINDAKAIARKLIDSQDDLESASKTLKEYLDNKTDVQKKAVQEYQVTFSQRADENKTHRNEKFLSFKLSGSWMWLFGSFLFGVITFYLSFYFLNEKVNSVGEAVLRISLLVIPAYFALFCSQQFLYHKRLYESYSFKETAVNTMTKLIATSADEKTRDKILSRSLEVIFSEPTHKNEKGAYNQQLVSELIGMLKDQINK